MMADIGESLVGSYFKYVLGCKIVIYNVHYEYKQGEIDLIAFSNKMKKIYMCEVITHIRGALYGDGYDDTLKRLQNKIIRASEFGIKEFPDSSIEMQIWTPVVSSGLEKRLREELVCPADIPLKVVTNGEYTEKINAVIAEARKRTHATDEPAFRLLQIIEHMKK